MNIKMKLATKPEEAFLGIATNDDYPIITGEGDTNYLCGNCQNILCKDVVEGQISGYEIECPKCGWGNKFE